MANVTERSRSTFRSKPLFQVDFPLPDFLQSHLKRDYKLRTTVSGKTVILQQGGGLNTYSSMAFSRWHTRLYAGLMDPNALQQLTDQFCQADNTYYLEHQMHLIV